MPPEQRLRRKSDFDAVFRKGVGVAAGPLALRARLRDEGHQEHLCRFGFAVSSRLGNAVRRNQVRRRLKESARRLNASGECAGLDVVVIARQGAVEADFSELDATLRRLVGRAASKVGMAAPSTAREREVGTS